MKAFIIIASITILAVIGYGIYDNYIADHPLDGKYLLDGQGNVYRIEYDNSGRYIIHKLSIEDIDSLTADKKK